MTQLEFVNVINVLLSTRKLDLGADQKEAMGIILHADAMDDAQKLRQMLVEKLPEMDIRIYPVGPVIGTHAGPGTIAFCFLGKKREI